MLASLPFLVCLFVSVTPSGINRVYPPSKLVYLALGTCKSVYLPFEPDQKFIKNEQIMELDSSKRRKRWFWSQPSKEKPACKVKGWTGKSFDNHETEVVMFKNLEQKLVVFAFRGSEPEAKDWLDNFKMFLTLLVVGHKRFYTHEGFSTRYGYIASWFEKEYKAVPSDYTIVLTGHSLGAAEATIAAVYATEKLKRKPDAIVTFGSPKVGDASFKEVYEKTVGCDRTLRITTFGDVITFVPAFWGYVHVCPQKIEYTFTTNPHGIYAGYTKAAEKYKDRGLKITSGCDDYLN